MSRGNQRKLIIKMKNIYHKLRERKGKSFHFFPLICDFRTSVLSFPRGLKNIYYIQQNSNTLKNEECSHCTQWEYTTMLEKKYLLQS